MDNGELIPHLFRTEYRKIIAVLCRHFGLTHIEIAEDIASETFLTAAQTWGVNGIPVNPVAWLYHVAKNKARNFLWREQLYENKILPAIKNETASFYEQPLDWSPQNINDSQLQMMFAICNPSISAESQVALSLRILCGFGVEEIAGAFLTNKETIDKRLYRAKEKLREEKIEIKLPAAAEIDQRLSPVLRTIYLLFNEGYFSSGQDKTLRKQLCLEAMRLCTMLVENETTNKPEVNALLSLMCFHASRFDARLHEDGELILYDEQDSNLWNTDLISKGGYFLHRASHGDKLSKYHLEAGIAYWHTIQADTKEKWENILQLYDLLLQIEYSAIAALNRTYALSKATGKTQAVKEAEKLMLTSNPFYYMLLGELYTDIDNRKAKEKFHKALLLTRTETSRQVIEKKINKL